MSRLKYTEFHFPDPRRTLDDGLLCIGGDLNVETLVEAYSLGVFPWPQAGYPLLWFSPPERGVLDFSDLHVARSLQKLIRKVNWTVSINRAFDQVIEACAEQERPGQQGTWILDSMEAAYKDMHRAGYAHSFEVWDGQDLIGGIYGVYISGVFSGESMFFHRPNASKFIFLQMVQYLQLRKINWLDIQMVTPNLAAFGGKYIPRDEFLTRLEAAHQNHPDRLFDK